MTATSAPPGAAWLPHYRQIELALRERIATMPPGDAAAVRRGAVPGVRRQPDDGPQRDAAAGRGRAWSSASPGAARSSRGAAVAPPRGPADDVLARDGAARPGADVAAPRPRDPPVHSGEAAALGLPPTEPVVVVRRLRLADDEPIALETAVLVRRTADVVMAADLEAGSLHEALARAGLHLRRGNATITAEAATPEDVRLLGVDRSAPLLVERRVIADTQGRPVEATESRYPGDRYALDVRFEVDDGVPDRGR